MSPGGPGERVRGLYLRHRRTFWIVHSVWALLTGCIVIVLAHRAWGFIPWVVTFLGLTWVSTVYFARMAPPRGNGGLALGREVTSYLTRIMYQETLFFLIPFYFYSTTLSSWNAAFLGILVALAVLACLDLAFDRLLRRSRLFALGYFGFVMFAALVLLIPVLTSLPPRVAVPAAAGTAFVTAVPLGGKPLVSATAGRWAVVAAGLLVVVAGAAATLPLVPPVPLRLEEPRFGAGIDPRTLELGGGMGSTAPRGALEGRRLAFRGEIFAPVTLQEEVRLRWSVDGRPLHRSRLVRIRPHSTGFRMWDTTRPSAGALRPGRYTVEVVTSGGQLVGRSSVILVGDGGGE